MTQERRNTPQATVWMSLWAELRGRLDGDDAFGRRGTLRWLESVFSEAGGHAGTVRNILYKDLGSITEKQLLFETLCDWHERVGLPRPPPPRAIAHAAAKQRMGASSRGVFTRFLRELSAGHRPQQVVVGCPRSGSVLLLEELRTAVERHVFLAFDGDAAPAVRTVLEAAGAASTWAVLEPSLDAHGSYAVQEACQRELRAVLADALTRLGRPLLAVADAACHLRGCLLRGPDGGATHPAWWVEALLQDLQVPYLAVVAVPPRQLTYRRLKPPDREEAVRFVHERLRQAPVERVRQLVDVAGLDYAELTRAALLEASRRAGQPSRELLQDPHLGPLLLCLAVLSSADDPWVPLELLEAAAGIAYGSMSVLQRSLIDLAADGTARPAEPALLPADPHAPAIDGVAATYYGRHPHPARQLRHARRCGDRESILNWLRLDPSLLALAPGLWEESRAWPASDRERLAAIVLRRHAVRRHHDHPEVHEATEVLRSAPNARGEVWANLELAEAAIDNGRFDQARAVLDSLGALSGEERARALLGRAALARWRGSYERAEELVNEVMTLDLPDWMTDRAQLWHGLIAKDRGDLGEALDRLARVTHKPLLMARAAYHVGDTLVHLGQPDAAAQRLEDAIRVVESEGSAEESARVRTRRAAAMRHLGRYEDAARELEHAQHQALDTFARHRVAQEAAALESARGHGWEALCLAASAARFFEGTRERPDEARFRLRFARFRLAIAQRTLEVGDPYRPPFRQVPAPRAAATLRALLTELGDIGGRPHREAALRHESLVHLATCVEPDEALALLAGIGDAVLGPAQAAVAALVTAQVQAAAGCAEESLTAFKRLRQLPPSPGLRAWALAACAGTLLRLGRIDEAMATIEQVAALPAVFREQVGRAWGNALLEADLNHVCAHWARGDRTLPLPDALAWDFGAPRDHGAQPPCATSLTDDTTSNAQAVRESVPPPNELVTAK